MALFVQLDTTVLKEPGVKTNRSNAVQVDIVKKVQAQMIKFALTELIQVRAQLNLPRSACRVLKENTAPVGSFKAIAILDFIALTVVPPRININATKDISVQMVFINNLVLLELIKIHLGKLYAQIARLETTVQITLPPLKNPVQ